MKQKVADYVAKCLLKSEDRTSTTGGTLTTLGCPQVEVGLGIHGFCGGSTLDSAEK